MLYSLWCRILESYLSCIEQGIDRLFGISNHIWHFSFPTYSDLYVLLYSFVSVAYHSIYLVFCADIVSMKLSEYARREGILYRAAWNRFKAEKIAGAYRTELGRIVVPEQPTGLEKKAVVYARVSSPKQARDVEAQAQRLQEYAVANGFTVVSVVKEVASGVNDRRPKLTKLLTDDTNPWGTLIVEHKDRLTRVGFEWFQVLLGREGRAIVVANPAVEEKSDLVADFVSIIYSFSARLYGLRSRKNRVVRSLTQRFVEERE